MTKTVMSDAEIQYRYPKLSAEQRAEMQKRQADLIAGGDQLFAKLSDPAGVRIGIQMRPEGYTEVPNDEQNSDLYKGLATEIAALRLMQQHGSDWTGVFVRRCGHDFVIILNPDGKPEKIRDVRLSEALNGTDGN